MSVDWAWQLPHPSRRAPLLADDVVATSQPLAAQAGLEALAAGGNAVDAALATAVTLTVVEPTSNGIGGDAFAIVWDGSRVHGLNASGRSPAGLDPTAFRGGLPLYGWDSVTVPGAVSAWAALSQRFGRLPFAELCAAAVRHARDGFPVSPLTAAAWARAPEVYAGYPEFAATFLPAGRAPRPGERVRLPDHARTLERIAETGGAAFYTGDLAEAIVRAARQASAPLAAGDLAAHRPEWVEPLTVTYGSLTVHELPPNTQGVAALLALGILGAAGAAELAAGSADSIHLQLEAMKLALADTYRHVADPAAMTVRPADLLAEERLRARAAEIDLRRAGDPGHEPSHRGGTVYLAAADRDGMAVSFIQSNYHGFGSGVVVPGTGIALHNRGAGFSALPEHPNCVAPGKRPFHTIIPGLLTAGERCLGAFGVMGGAMQAQGHVQVVAHLADGANPQAALDAPRWRVGAGRSVSIEAGLPPALLDELVARGHRVEPAGGVETLWTSLGGEQTVEQWGFGGGQGVFALPGGGWLGASDPRKDGAAVGR